MEMILFVGVRNVGKTQYYYDNFSKDHVFVDFNMFRPTNEKMNTMAKIEEKFRATVNILLKVKQPVVIEFLNLLSKKERAFYINKAKSYNSKVHCIYFVPPEDAPDIRRVQEITEDEGFDSITYINQQK